MIAARLSADLERRRRRLTKLSGSHRGVRSASLRAQLHGGARLSLAEQSHA